MKQIAWTTSTACSSMRVKRYTFDSLICELAALEREHGLSSFEVYAKYRREHVEHGNELMEHWLNLIFLILGTDEINEFSCRQAPRTLIDTRGRYETKAEA